MTKSHIISFRSDKRDLIYLDISYPFELVDGKLIGHYAYSEQEIPYNFTRKWILYPQEITNLNIALENYRNTKKFNDKVKNLLSE